jgi:hypothetical protein
MKKAKLTDSESGGNVKKQDRTITGRDLTDVEEIRTRINTLVDLLGERGILNVKEFERIVMMRLHEVSKATAFEELDEEL